MLANLYLMAANLGAFAFAGLTTGAAHLLEAFGDDTLRERFMIPLYEGRWTGTMALTEPQAGSSLTDVKTRARYRVRRRRPGAPGAVPVDDGDCGATGSRAPRSSSPAATTTSRRTSST